MIVEGIRRRSEQPESWGGYSGSFSEGVCRAESRSLTPLGLTHEQRSFTLAQSV